MGAYRLEQAIQQQIIQHFNNITITQKSLFIPQSIKSTGGHTLQFPSPPPPSPTKKKEHEIQYKIFTISAMKQRPRRANSSEKQSKQVGTNRLLGSSCTP